MQHGVFEMSLYKYIVSKAVMASPYQYTQKRVWIAFAEEVSFSCQNSIYDYIALHQTKLTMVL